MANRTDLPTFPFAGGPARGERAVFPTDEGTLPLFTIVREPLHQPTWEIPEPLPHEVNPTEHVYQRVRLADPPRTGYAYLRSMSCGGPRITCPWCGLTSVHPRDVSEGYCGKCHDWTRIERYAVLRADNLDPVPEWDGGWLNRATAFHAAPIGPWNAHATGTFERGIAGGYAEVILMRAVDPISTPA